MLIRREENNDVIWGIWKIEETIDDLLSRLQDHTFSSVITSEKRLREKTAVRVLLKTLINEEKAIGYSSNGKPYLMDDSYFISISHTKGYAAVILSKTQYVGIDIEYISEKVKRVRDKFISQSEYIYENISTIHLLLHWSAKESMYKAIRMNDIDFRRNLLIEKFIPAKSGTFTGRETFTKEKQKFLIRYFVTDEYVITIIY